MICVVSLVYSFFLMFEESIKLVPRLVVAVSNGNTCEIIRPLLSPQAGAAMLRRVYRTRLICVKGLRRPSFFFDSINLVPRLDVARHLQRKFAYA